MTISILRGERVDEFEIPDRDFTTLEALKYIKENLDSSLTFRSGCRSGVCGSCSVRVNQREVLACESKVKSLDIIEPLKGVRVIRDLVVDLNSTLSSLKRAKANLTLNKNSKESQENSNRYIKESSCILCGSCHSSCPVFEINSDFISPFALSRIYRYSLDSREGDLESKFDSIQENGIWECTLCGNCSIVCPKGIDIKMNISMLRNRSVVKGYEAKLPSPTDFNSNFGINFQSFS